MAYFFWAGRLFVDLKTAFVLEHNRWKWNKQKALVLFELDLELFLEEEDWEKYKEQKFQKQEAEWRKKRREEKVAKRGGHRLGWRRRRRWLRVVGGGGVAGAAPAAAAG